MGLFLGGPIQWQRRRKLSLSNWILLTRQSDKAEWREAGVHVICFQVLDGELVIMN